MSYPVFMVPAGDVLPVLFSTFDGGTGASITMTGLAASDIEIYKDGSATQRASDAGYTLLDTDGIDFDGITGIHGFSIDTGDNTDSGFYTVGSWFTVVVSAVTVDAQTVNFIACQFRLMAAESVAAKPKVDVDAWLGTAAATPSVAGVPEVDLTHVAGATTNVAALATNVDAILTDTSTTLQNELDGIQADTEDIQSKIGTPSDFGSGTSTLAANLQDLADNGTAAYDRSTDSLQALRDHVGDGTNLTEAGGTGDQLTAINLPDQTMNITGNITGNLSGSVGSLATQAKADVNAEADSALATALTEAYAAAGSTGSVAQLLYEIRALLAEKSISTTTLTTKKLDGSTTAATYTLDDATNPSSITRAT